MSEQNKVENSVVKSPGVTNDTRLVFGVTRTSTEDAAQAKKDAEMARLIAAMPMRIRMLMI